MGTKDYTFQASGPLASSQFHVQVTPAKGLVLTELARLKTGYIFTGFCALPRRLSLCLMAVIFRPSETIGLGGMGTLSSAFSCWVGSHCPAENS